MENPETIAPSSETQSPVKTAVKPEEMSPKKKAEVTFALGKRDYLIRDYPAAVENLSQACQLMSAIHGDSGDELGDAFFYYGKALFAASRLQIGVLGDQLEKDKNDTADDEDEEDGGDDNEEEESEGENGDNESKENGEKAESAETPKENGHKEANENGDSGKTGENGDSVKSGENGVAKEASGEGENGQPVAEGEGGGDPDETAEADDLQLSWEVLEMAKVIFQRKADEDKDVAVKLAEVYLALGEIGLESESYTTAANDFTTCLEIQRKNLEEDDRRIAETLYQIGMAESMSENFDGAVTQFQASIEQLEKRLTHLKKLKESGAGDSDVSKTAFYSIDGEVEEINGTIKDIKDKILDMEDYKKHSKKEIAEHLANTIAGIASTDGASTSSSSATGLPPKTPEKVATCIQIRKKPKEETDKKPESTSNAQSSADSSEEAKKNVESTAQVDKELSAKSAESNDKVTSSQPNTGSSEEAAKSKDSAMETDDVVEKSGEEEGQKKRKNEEVEEVECKKQKIDSEEKN